MSQQYQQINDNIWVYPHNRITIEPAIGIIMAESATVLVDAGNGPLHAERIRQTLVEMNAPPVRYVIHTHFHWDHTFGTQIWKRSIVISHVSSRGLLLKHYGGDPWSPERVEEEIRLNPLRKNAFYALQKAIGDWRAFLLVPASLVFTDELTLILDEEVFIHVQHVGGQHAPDSITVQVGDVLFLGDCFNPPATGMGPANLGYNFEMMHNLLDQDVAYYIDSHNPPRTRAEFAEFLEQNERS